MNPTTSVSVYLMLLDGTVISVSTLILHRMCGYMECRHSAMMSQVEFVRIPMDLWSSMQSKEMTLDYGHV